MSRTLLLVFVHGFKGNTQSFYTFPEHLKELLKDDLSDHEINTAVYPKYETAGDLASCTSTFLDWLKERVIEIRKQRSEIPWPPQDRSVGVILVAHSMGGLVASDALFQILDAHSASTSDSVSDRQHLFPLIQGLLAFDTPYDGLARSMFVYGGFSQYQKVSSVWNMMSAAGAGLLSARSIGQASKTAASQSKSLVKNKNWGLWQAVAIRSGTVGAIAAGGVAAYIHREQIIKGVKGIRNVKLDKESLKEGYNQSYDAIGQGLAYINRDSVGQSFAWLSSHLKFVGALMQQKDMNLRLERLAGLSGIGVKNIFTSMGENGYWSGGYFVPERTFCAVPSKGQKGEDMFIRNVNSLADDEIKAHMSMFRPDQNDGYEQMSLEAKKWVIQWFNDESEIVDSAPFPVSSEAKETETTADGDEIPKISEDEVMEATNSDESPLDIVAVAAAIPLPDDEKASEATEQQTYLRSLFRIANNAGTGLRSMIGKKRGPPSVGDDNEKSDTVENVVAMSEEKVKAPEPEVVAGSEAAPLEIMGDPVPTEAEPVIEVENGVGVESMTGVIEEPIEKDTSTQETKESVAEGESMAEQNSMVGLESTALGATKTDVTMQEPKNIL